MTVDIPLGLCQCGCGEPTKLPRWSDAKYGHVKGQPMRYIFGHTVRAANRRRAEAAPAPSPCTVDGCEKPASKTDRSMGLCATHRSRMRRYGSIEVPSLQQVFWSHVEKTPTCWVWTGRLTTDFYGYLPTGGGGPRHYILAHRYVYELLVAPIPDGLTIDHLCHNRDGMCPGGSGCPHKRCVNPWHLEAVPSSVNTRRAMTSRATCKWGHPWTPENTAHYGGRRHCRQCSRDRTRLHKLRVEGRPIPSDLQHLCHVDERAQHEERSR